MFSKFDDALKRDCFPRRIVSRHNVTCLFSCKLTHRHLNVTSITDKLVVQTPIILLHSPVGGPNCTQTVSLFFRFDLDLNVLLSLGLTGHTHMAERHLAYGNMPQIQASPRFEPRHGGLAALLYILACRRE